MATTISYLRLLGEQFFTASEDWKRLGNRITPKYSKLDDMVCVCSPTSEVRWTERQLFFKLGAAFGRRLAKEPKSNAVKCK